MSTDPLYQADIDTQTELILYQIYNMFKPESILFYQFL